MIKIKKKYSVSHITAKKKSNLKNKTKKNSVIKNDGRYRKRFCPKCGNIIKENTVLCAECFKPDFDFKDINIIICNSCHSYWYKNKWTKYDDVYAAIKKISMENVKAKIKVLKISKELKEKIYSYKAGIKEDIMIEMTREHQTFDIPAKLEVTLCPNCSKKGTQFFDSIIQLRNCNEEILRFARNEVNKQNKKGIFINKEVPIEKYSIKDIDLYLTNQTYAKTLAEKIKKNFGGIIKKNAKHFSLNWQTTKTIYRLNILLLLPNYSKNDVIKEENHLYKIMSIGDKIHVEDLKTKHKTSVANKDSYDILKPALFQVIKKYPEYEVLDPNTYYQAKLMNPSKALEINQKIKVIIDGGEAWMI